MKRIIPTTRIAFLSVSLFGLVGCSSYTEETAATAAGTPNAATKSGLADAQKNAESQAAKLKAEVSAALSKQREEVLSEPSASTSSLTNQVTGL
jgi:hypothetical protein